MKHLILWHLLGAFITVAACSPTDDDSPTVTDLLTQATWAKIVNLEDANLDGVFVEFGEECEKDNFCIFKADQSYEYNIGPIACPGDPGADYPIPGTWTLSENETLLTISLLGGEPLAFEILNIEADTLELGVVETDNPAGVYTQKLLLSR